MVRRYVEQTDAWEFDTLDAFPHIIDYDKLDFLRVYNDDSFEVRTVYRGDVGCLAAVRLRSLFDWGPAGRDRLRLAGVPFNEPRSGRAADAGAATAVFVAAASTSAKLAIASLGVGALTSSPHRPVQHRQQRLTGVVQNSKFWVNTSLVGGANLKQVIQTPIAANSAVFTLQVQFANGSAADLTSSDELNCEIWTARSANP